jgi:uncharacterized protein (TIGR00369 family)
MAGSEWQRELEPFIEFLGVRIAGGQELPGMVELDLVPSHTNRFQAAHGGVLMTLLDFTMARACRAADDQARAPITIEMKASFIRPGQGRLRCSGTCVHASKSIAFAEARVTDAAGETIASASGTYKYRPA